ncbi:hypothetical protein FG737_24730, partial [Salmonella enterica subsp. enterica serovar London]
DTANAQIIDLQEYREAIDHERNRQSEEIQRHQRVSGADRTAGLLGLAHDLPGFVGQCRHALGQRFDLLR